MNPKIKIAAKATSIILLITLTSFITIKFQERFPPRTEIKVVFENSTFADMPLLRPIKEITTYLFIDCNMAGKQFGETITSKEIDEAIEKLRKEKND